MVGGVYEIKAMNPMSSMRTLMMISLMSKLRDPELELLINHEPQPIDYYGSIDISGRGRMDWKWSCHLCYGMY